MEKTIVVTGKSIDLAIESALTQLGLDRDSVSVEVLSQAKSGFLGLGAQPAKIQVTYEAPDPAPKVALSSASRSKPKAEKKPAPKVEAPKVEKKPEPKTEAPKAENHPYGARTSQARFPWPPQTLGSPVHVSCTPRPFT